MSDSTLQTTLAEAIGVLERQPVLSMRGLSDDAFDEVTRLSVRLLHLAQSRSAAVAGEVAHRSRPELGSSGLAHRLGHRTPEAMVRAVTGSTAREASSAVRVGRLVESDPGRPWLDPVGAAVAAGVVTVSGAEAISAGLGGPTETVTAESLAKVAAALAGSAGDQDADALYRLARSARDDIDEAGIADREAQRFAARSLTVHRQPDGMVKLIWTLDPESAATVLELFDRATSPRRGGPRFVSGPAAEQADRIASDERTTVQIGSDTFLQLVQAGASADSSQLLASGGPVIRILTVVAEAGAHTPTGAGTDTGGGARTGVGAGHGFIEGQPDPVGAATLDRLACTAATTQIVLNQLGQPLDVGREQRLFTRAQRVALAARDGGCFWPGCDRPPSWTEAHHINHWKSDHGKTDLNDGVLLCKHHHLTLHNNGWKITRTANQYYLHPPLTIDRQQRPILLASKSRAWREATGNAQWRS